MNSVYASALSLRIPSVRFLFRLFQGQLQLFIFGHGTCEGVESAATIPDVLEGQARVIENTHCHLPSY